MSTQPNPISAEAFESRMQQLESKLDSGEKSQAVLIELGTLRAEVNTFVRGINEQLAKLVRNPDAEQTETLRKELNIAKERQEKLDSLFARLSERATADADDGIPTIPLVGE